MRVFKFGIGAVDGVRDYRIITPEAKEALAFAQAHDHEGSTVTLEIAVILPSGTVATSMEYYNEDAYRQLQEHSDGRT